MMYKQIEQLYDKIETFRECAKTDGGCGEDEIKVSKTMLERLSGYAEAVKHSFEEVDTEIITRCKECTFLSERGECRIHLSLCPTDDFYCRDGRPKEENEKMTERIYEKDGALLKPKEEIIRCKDCRFQANPINDAINPCMHNSGLMNAKDDNFCPYGERMTGK